MLKAIYLDMDGVLVDLVRHTYSRAGVNKDDIDQAFAETTVWDGITPVLTDYFKEEWVDADLHRLWASQEFWASIPWTSHGKELYEMCTRYAPVVLMTTPTIQPACAAGKMEWIQKHMPYEQRRRYALSPCKHHMAHPGAMLIDDGEHNIDKFQEHGGETFLWPDPWNENGKSGMTFDAAMSALSTKLGNMKRIPGE